MEDLRQVVVVDHRVGQHDLPAARRAGPQQVALGADRGHDAGHQLLADGVQRRVGDLREELGEVVVHEPGTGRQHGDGRVGAHRAERFGAGARHRTEEDLQLLLGVAEGLLPALHRVVGVDHVLTLGQRVEVHQPGVQPVRVRLVVGERRLDLVVGDDAPGGRVDQEHLARRRAPLRHDRRRVEVEHPGLTGEHHQPVARLPPPARPQAVAVEDRADDRAVGERHAGGPVPRLHQ